LNEPQSVQPEDKRQRTILIVEDCPEDRESYRRYLLVDPEGNYVMVEAESGKAGLQQWRQWLVSYYPLKDGGDRVLGVNVMVQEITDRKRTEEILARLGQIA
jgi:CheY-like chemotaxis protein